MLPIVGGTKATYEFTNQIQSGQELSSQDYFLAALSIVGGGKGKALTKVTGETQELASRFAKTHNRMNKQRTIYKEYTGYEAKGQVHHGLPEQFNEWFSDHGVDVNNPKFYYELPEGLHKLKEYNGIHTNNSPLGKNRNAV